MATKAVKTQKTELYFVTNADPAAMMKIGQVSQTTLNGGSAAEIDITNFDSDQKESEAGLPDPGTLSFDLVSDPGNASHQALDAIYNAGVKTTFFVCMSDGTAAPTLASNVPTAPASRSGFQFLAFVQQITNNGATDEVWKSTVQLRVSGKVTRFYASAP